MKRVLIIFIISLSMTMGAAAQHFYHGGRYGYGYGRPRISIGIGSYVPLYPYYGMYSPFYRSRPYGYSATTSKLALEIEDINNDYRNRIWMVKHDKNLSRRERRIKVHDLKHERENAIIDAKKDYYRY